MKSQLKLSGAISALVTPFESGAVDYKSFAKLVEFQLKNGIRGFVVNGTTAESPTLSWNEVEKLYASVREIVGSRVPVIVGTGSNATVHTIEMTKKAEDLGADAALVVVPYYNKPPQRGLVAHFSETAKNTKLPIILYNVPGRTITGMTLETILELAKNENIVAIKEASGDVSFDENLKRKLPERFTLLSGDDPTYIPFLKIGGTGIISVMSNALTAACERWAKLAQDKKWQEVEQDFAKYKQLIALMYVEANPIPIKWILFKMGIISSPEMRLPLMELEQQYYEKITTELKNTGTI